MYSVPTQFMCMGPLLFHESCFWLIKLCSPRGVARECRGCKLPRAPLLGAPEEDHAVYWCWTTFYKVCLRKSRIKDACGLGMWNGWREKDYQSQLSMNTRSEREAEEAKEDRDGQCQGRPEREKHRFDQDWRGDQKQRGLEKSYKSLFVSSLMEE